jgi:hypothetical protein
MLGLRISKTFIKETPYITRTGVRKKAKDRPRLVFEKKNFIKI